MKKVLPKNDEVYKNAIKNSTEISDATKSVYMYSIQRMQRATNMTIHEILLHADEVYAVLKKEITHEPTLKTTVASVLAILKHGNYKANNKKIFGQWYKVYVPLMKTANAMRENNIPSDRQKNASIPWESVLRQYQSLCKKEFGSDNHLLLAFYVLLKPRRQGDYYRIRVLRKSPEGKESVGDDSAFVVLGSSEKPYISVLQYKTAKTLKPWTRPLPDELINILKRSLSARKRKYVFAQSDGEAFKTRNSFTQFSNRVLKHTLGENITVNSLRHAYASYRNKLALTLKQRQMDAMDMGHSLETHLSYAVDGVNNKTITLKRFKNSSKKS
jgi:hypothetical protein